MYYDLWTPFSDYDDMINLPKVTTHNFIVNLLFLLFLQFIGKFIFVSLNKITQPQHRIHIYLEINEWMN